MVDYSIFFRRPITAGNISKELPSFDIFVSAFNSSERVSKVFSEAKADRKIWIIHPEYQYVQIEELGDFEIVRPDKIDEKSQVDALLAKMGELNGKNICFDITGFMRHVLAFLVAKLAHMGISEFTAIYSEPMSYAKQEDTTFTTRISGCTGPVMGMAGTNSSRGQEYLILAVGYDHKLISEVTSQKDITVYPIFGFPSLSPDMYQQSAVCASQSGEVALNEAWTHQRRFAPAHDPFSTAGIVRDIVKEIDEVNSGSDAVANIYLSPLATKAQVLGFSLYWQLEGKSRGGVTMLLPQCETYSRETSLGLKRLWVYTVELN